MPSHLVRCAPKAPQGWARACIYWPARPRPAGRRSRPRSRRPPSTWLAMTRRSCTAPPCASTVDVSPLNVLTLRLHTDGGPVTFTGQTHRDFPRVLEAIARPWTSGRRFGGGATLERALADGP